MLRLRRQLFGTSDTFFFFFTVYMWNAPSTMSSCEEVLAQDNMVMNLDDSEGQRGSLRTREEGFLLI